MTKPISEQKPLPTIWRTPDDLWEKIEPILAEYDPPKSTGRPRVDQRASLDAIIFRLRTGYLQSSPTTPACIEPSSDG
jgi:hypothetical protein